jgi:branched-subunit amino acid ABC-type transport system permease component
MRVKTTRTPEGGDQGGPEDEICAAIPPHSAQGQGVLLGGLYAQYALGMALMFGVMRVVNITHGDLMILLALVGISLASTFGLGPWSVLVVLVALGGIILQR